MVYVLLMLSVLFSTQCANNPKIEKKAELYLQLGTAHLQNQNYPAALKDLKSAYSLSPDNPIINNNLGLAYFVRDELHKALFHFNIAIKKNPKYTEARSNLGRTYAELGRYSLSIQQLELALKDLTYQYPQKVYANLGYTYFLMKKYQLAYNNFKLSLKLDPNNCVTQSYFAKTLYEMNEFKLSIQSFNQTLDECGKNTLEEPYYYNALNYYKLGLFHQARAQIDTLKTIFPKGNFIVKANKLLKIME
jgi:Tfp pilus assembly protein PilF